ncbi:keratin, type I cytoskeletal 18-A [Salmo trutta]|uniref:Keratin, type I cytoskeletal 18-A-like n=1 Tax=Salmo trutta TaxID=8032 RepID=A0A673WD61_SALTR|nr:keratin, type I cytoskeletal 18-A-like [Salmo trutta]XP_029632792.1 keratin, type I cytoskeletal 18-A-like [Salmo trutta]XP_029632794.1 keratin, type I cytoskeletal 18-A-like [Salmo trutta]
MDLLQDSQWTMQGLNSRLKGFLEQVNKLQKANWHLEGQIAYWGLKNAPHPQEWTQQERTVDDLRAQVGKLLMENAELVLQSDHMMSRASTIQARCELEERQTKCLEQQVALLRENKTRVEHTNVQLEAELHNSMTELQDMHQDYVAARALQQQQADSCDALLVTATAWEEDGTGMELSQLLDRIRTQCDRLSLTGLNQVPDDRHPGLAAAPNQTPCSAAGPSRFGATLRPRAHGGSLPQLNAEEAAWAQVNLGGTALREARAELAEARKQWHCLQVEIESLHALEKGLESSLHHTKRQYSSQLQGLSEVIQGLEGELEQVRGGLATQQERHGQLLNTKMRLEKEIATYRRLLEREEGRYPGGRNGQAMGLRRWRGPKREPGPIGEEPKENGVEENGLSDPAVTPEEPLSEPLPERPQRWSVTENGLRKSPALTLYRQQSLVILTEPERDNDLRISTVKTQEILQGNVVRESAEGTGTVETDRIDKVIKQWEGSFFKGNPKLRKKSVSLRFDLHMAAADEGCAQTKQDSLPDVEVRLVMKRSRSIPTIAANVEATV